MRIQLWSYNYDPEPTGIGPVSTLLAKGLRDLGQEVSVVTAHPHYPTPAWGTRFAPYRESREGIGVLRLPLWIGRDTPRARIRQELSFMTAQFAALPFLGRPDLLVSASPSFPALLPGIVNVAARRVPWVLWLHDILPDGATASRIVERGPILGASRWLERHAYRAAQRIVVLSRPFVENLRAKGVPDDKLELIYDPATRQPLGTPGATRSGAKRRILSMGNIGHTQGLAPLAAEFDRSRVMARMDAHLVITGDGVAADEVRDVFSGDRIEMLGVVSDERLEWELRSATLALVSQSYGGTEFNLPSKLMNFMAYGLPVIAAVNPCSEVARIVNESGCGWVVDSSRPRLFPARVAEALNDPPAMEARAAAGMAYAREHFSSERFIERFNGLLQDVAREAQAGTRAASRS